MLCDWCAVDVCAAITMFLAMYMVLPDLQRYVWCRAVMALYICVHAAVEITLAIHKYRRAIMRYLNLKSKLSRTIRYALRNRHDRTLAILSSATCLI